MSTKILSGLALAAILFASCSKNKDSNIAGKTGDATLVVSPKFTKLNNGVSTYGYVTSGTVYIKYGATTAPAAGTPWDDSAKCIQMDGFTPAATFVHLSNGDYYIYFNGKYDTYTATGGTAYTITQQNVQQIFPTVQ